MKTIKTSKVEFIKLLLTRLRDIDESHGTIEKTLTLSNNKNDQYDIFHINRYPLDFLIKSDWALLQAIENSTLDRIFGESFEKKIEKIFEDRDSITSISLTCVVPNCDFNFSYSIDIQNSTVYNVEYLPEMVQLNLDNLTVPIDFLI